MKEYEHQRLEQCVGMNVKVGEKYVLPKTQAFGLSWSNAKGSGYSPRCTEVCHRTTTGWRSPPDPTDKMMDDMGPVVDPAQVLELMSGLGVCKWPPTR